MAIFDTNPTTFRRIVPAVPAALHGAMNTVLDMRAAFDESEADRYDLHARHLNNQMVRVLRTIGFDARFTRGRGPYLWDAKGDKYLDLLSGWGVFALGRNHPHVAQALRSVLDSDLPNLVQMDVSPLAGRLAQRLLQRTPWLDKAFFANSGAEAVEAALKFARAATGRAGVIYCENAFHGLTYGPLSAAGDKLYRDGFGPLLPDFRAIPFDDLPALERDLRNRDVAAFLVEPIQGKIVRPPSPGYLREAQALCRKYGTLFIADEIQTGLGRTGKFLAVEHFGAEPDMVLLAKGLSGGHVPVGVVLMRRETFGKVFDRMDRAVVHGSTFAKNDLAMAAGLATLDVIESEKLIENAAAKGERLARVLKGLMGEVDYIKDVRGLGLMLAIELGEPKSLKLRAFWAMLEAVSKGLTCQLVTIPLFKDQKVLVQVAGHGSRAIKLLPALTLADEDCDWIERAFADTLRAANDSAGPIWALGKQLVEGARASAGK